MSEVVAEGIIETRALQALIDVQRTMVEEAKINLNDGGVTMRAVDPANVGMNFTELDVGAFESWDAPGSVTIGVNLERFEDALDPAGKSQLVNIALDMESRKLHVDVDHIHQEIALIDPDTIRQEPDEPGLDLPNTAVLEGGDVSTAIDVVGNYGDHVDIIGDAESNELVVETEGDTDATTITFDGERAIMVDVVEETTSMYSEGYLADLTDPVPSDTEVRFTFGDEFPMRLSWTAVDGNLDVEQMLAPRVKAE